MNTEKVKISKWLADRVGSHEICNVALLEKDFTEYTGEVVKFDSYTVKAARAALKERGIGGYVKGKDSERVTDGCSVAEQLADIYAKDQPRMDMMGRGSRYHEALGALIRAGK